jgi:hypothetical protein
MAEFLYYSSFLMLCHLYVMGSFYLINLIKHIPQDQTLYEHYSIPNLLVDYFNRSRKFLKIFITKNQIPILRL